MTDPRLRDPHANHAHYAENEGYRRDDSRLAEERVLWAKARIAAAFEGGARRLLDLGCNDGFLAQLLPEGMEYAGVELNRVAAANPYPRAAGRIVLGDVTRDQFPAGPWDVVVCMEALEHVINPAALLRRVRVEALGGEGAFLSTSATGLGLAYEPGNREHLREWAPQEFVDLHTAAGFAVVEGRLAKVYEGRLTTCVLAVPRRGVL